MSGQYTNLAAYYDRLNPDVDYAAWAGAIDKKLRELGIPEGSLTLDLGCGTGNITLPLARLGWDMIGIDLSPEMLTEARGKAYEAELDILLLMQDMTEFELYGTVRATVCCLDSLNYILEPDRLCECFRLVRLYTEAGGAFIFDMNTPYKFEHTYADRTYLLEDEGVFLAWENYYDAESMICDFILTFFVEDADGRYRRLEETQRERCYSREFIEASLRKCGFEIVEVASSYDGDALREDSERWHFVCRAV